MIESRRFHIESRREFERNLHILQEAMRNRKVLFSSSVQGPKRMERSFKKARELPNKRINFNTIDETVRLTANMVGMDINAKLKRDGEE